MIEDQTFLPDTSNPFPVAPDPMFAGTKKKAKKDVKQAIVSADPSGATMHEGGDPSTPDEGDIFGEQYKFKAVDNPEGDVEDYTETIPKPKGYVQTAATVGQGGLLQEATDPKQLSAADYDKLTKEASKGNKLAQQILVTGHYKAHNYPSLSQDLAKIDDPFVAALSGLPAMAENEQANANKVTQPYDFSNAEGQVNNLLGQMGSNMTMTTSPETNTYLGQLNNIVASGANNLNTSTLGLPSIMTALGAEGPAAKESEKATPYASLLAALLSHQQYETVYGGQSPASSGDPAWLQNLIASVTGTAIGGGLVSPSVAAGSVGTTPSTSATPTGSNG